MKIIKLFILTALTLSANSFADQISGTIVQFSGRYVESRKPYSYAALKTANGSKLRLPEWIDGEALAKLKNNKVTFEADITAVYCTDMSSACADGKLSNIKSVIISLSKKSKYAQTISDRLERHSGRAVESRNTYDYISIGQENISVPSFLNADALLEANALLTVVGVPRHLMCTDMSAACGPTKMIPLNSVVIKL